MLVLALQFSRSYRTAELRQPNGLEQLDAVA